MAPSRARYVARRQSGQLDVANGDIRKRGLAIVHGDGDVEEVVHEDIGTFKPWKLLQNLRKGRKPNGGLASKGWKDGRIGADLGRSASAVAQQWRKQKLSAR
ncbi:hypothetical protein F5883DRAFT_526059 [Diaporthe sp. PMI_573]|nr:hypothetical protein F5883DRAFT_526059 [Diaporthaceae sp. PMI_573]